MALLLLHANPSADGQDDTESDSPLKRHAMASHRGHATLQGPSRLRSTEVIADLWASDEDGTWGGILYAGTTPFAAWVDADQVLYLILAEGAVGTVLVSQRRRRQNSTMLEVVGTSEAPFVATGHRRAS